MLYIPGDIVVNNGRFLKQETGESNRVAVNKHEVTDIHVYITFIATTICDASLWTMLLSYHQGPPCGTKFFTVTTICDASLWTMLLSYYQGPPCGTKFITVTFVSLITAVKCVMVRLHPINSKQTV